MSRRNLPTHRPPTHPGEMLLEEFLKPLGIAQAEFAKRIRVSYVRLNAVINGRRGVTFNTALRPGTGNWNGRRLLARPSDRLGSLARVALPRCAGDRGDRACIGVIGTTVPLWTDPP